MFPYLYFGEYKIELYNTLNFLGMFILVINGIHWNYKHGPKYPISLGILLFIAPIATILGKIFFFVLLDSPNSKIQFFNLNEGGYMALGTILGGIFGALVYFELKKVPKVEGLEIFIPYIPIGAIFSRLGCFCAGCCYGTITNSIFGLRFPMGSLVWAEHVNDGLISPDQFFSLPVHPIQLYEIGMWIIAGIILIVIRNQRPSKGVLIFLFIIFAFLMRFVEDFVRADYNKVFWNLDLMQVLALFIIPLSLLGILLIYRDRFLPHSFREKNQAKNSEIENDCTSNIPNA